jgi:dTDP-4-dehydrorhamnose 3,5-epimerase
MKAIPTPLPGMLILEPAVYGDSRGFFYESFNERVFAEASGVETRFVQDNHSRSRRNVLRGLHYQIRQAQGKLVRVASGEVFDVGVDIRKHSATFGKWFGVRLSAENKRQLWLPPGFAHGFLVTSDWAELLYKTTDYYAPQYEMSIRWNDPALAIEWPLRGQPILSVKDERAPLLPEPEVFA